MVPKMPVSDDFRIFGHHRETLLNISIKALLKCHEICIIGKDILKRNLWYMFDYDQATKSTKI